MLRHNENNNSFVLYTDDIEAAEQAGLTFSKRIRGPNGEKVFYTADYNMQPVFNPYAVLGFFEEADDHARGLLNSLARDYGLSWDDGLTGDLPDYPVPDGLEYLAYQRAGIRYALEHKNCIIGDEPGLGKTIQAIGVANACGARNILIICPASIRLNWQKEIRLWSTIPNVRTYPIMKGSDGVSPFAHYTICSYDLARNHSIHAALMSQDWDLIIMDEAHYLKTPEAQRTRAVFGGGEVGSFFYQNGLETRAERLIGMTGTPLPNRPRECYTLARGLDWMAIDFLSQDEFNFRFNPSMTTFDGVKLEERGRLPELQARLRCNMMVRRHKKTVLPQLPDKRYEMTYLEPNGDVREILAQESLIDFDPKDLFNPDFSLDGTPISTLRREMGEAMVPEVVEYLKYNLDIVELPKIIVFAHHTSVIERLATALAAYGVCPHHGKMSSRAKEQSKIDFINGKPRIFLGQLDTMEGVDGLQDVADNVFFPEAAWTPGRNEQCVDRAHRLGQHSNVIAHFLLIEGSFNEKVLNVVLGKAGDIHEALDRRLL